MNSVLIVGCGDVGQRIGRRLLARGVRVIGVVRRAAAAADLTALGIDAQVIDLDASPAAALPEADTVFWCAPPPGTGVTDPRLRRYVLQLTGRRVVYGSTTGVYGDCGGRWIDEDEPTEPLHDRGRRRLDAETGLRSSGIDHVVLRIPGIYGPGRWPLQRLRAGTPVIDPAEAPPSNRIHAEDLAEVALLAAERGALGQVYHVGDGQPTTMTDYFYRVADHFGIARPPAVSLAEAERVFTPAQWSFIAGAKRIRVDRAFRELGFSPRYTDLSQALAEAP
jgi:nucleoside-diphosphate-sugar epimerase